MKFSIINRWIAAGLIAWALLLVNCTKENYTSTTTSDVNIVGYLRNHKDSFSLFQQILEKTEFSNFLNAYGKYTCFAPTNQGVQKWLQSIGAASIDAVDMDKLKDMVRFHVLNDVVTTSLFKDGKLPVPTMYGQFLITGVAVENAVSSYTVNRQANVIQSNITVGNGVVHTIDNVLQLAELTIAGQLAKDPNYSIFVEALHETGYFDTLNTVYTDTAWRFKTVFAESNQVLADSGITSYAQLKARYSNKHNPALVTDSLHIYMSYHILPTLQFLGDIITLPSQSTLQPQEVISVKSLNQEVVINEDEFNGVLEKGITIERGTSDNAAANGVWHHPKAHYMVKFRKPVALFWDVCTFPEIVKQPGYYKKTNLVFAKPSQEARPIASIDWEYKSASASVTYSYATSGTINQSSCNNDLFLFGFGLPNRSSWMEFKTPPVIKGRYKVWICYSAVNAVQTNVEVNGVLMQRPVNWGEAKPSGTDNQLESVGWKRYTSNTTSYRPAGRLVGTIDIATTGIQTVRLTALSGSNGAMYLDMIHFIPVDDPQFLPRFGTDGLPVYQ
ncbi:Uncaracterized surface protein containing fasciclin (FAS1) repeats [Filimonas lacunae]|uniref:Uncaracterized surface protein containing fasciclin (FAS1) repeats n=1 Tax=Filimonas lacunae TaxID=477680 RepID=A0A173MHL7_9BACT|nr:fasciclin domain-containing protein [Filimonas lacunae]BAV07113.1 lipoprotein [Filimonas lacunae]SIS94843.1 Uncaracterized surface protein containing fasciclin (FAS1) repeats [Filimonas lacunae]